MFKFLKNYGHSNEFSVTVLFVIFSVLVQPVSAQLGVTEVRAVTIDGSARYIVEAKNIDEKYQIDVRSVGTGMVPLRPDQKLPVIYVLDGNTQFQVVAPLANLLASSRLSGAGEGIPQALVVSIGYVPDPSLSALDNFTNMTLMRRHRDYTPMLDSEWLQAHPELPPNGGAPSFLAFIETELKPFVASRYPVDDADQTIVGHSMGGLFVLYVLLHSPKSFDRYIAASPGLAWDDFRPLGAKVAFDGSQRDTPAKVYISAGGLEEADMIDTASAITQTLKTNSSNLDVTFELIPDEDHVSVIPSAMIRGLKKVFN